MSSIVLFFVPSIQSGGTESVVLRYCTQLSKICPSHIFSIVRNDMFPVHSSSFVFSTTSSRLYCLLSISFLRPVFYAYIFFHFLWRLLLFPSHIFCFGELPIIVAAPISLLCRILPVSFSPPQFVSSFRNDPSTLSLFKRIVLGLFLSCYKLSTTNSLASARYFGQSFCCFSRVIPLYNPLPCNFIAPKVRSSSNSGRQINILSVSRLEPQKNVSLMIEFIAFLKQNISDSFRLLVVGDGSESQALVDLSMQYGVNSCVEFLGPLSYRNVSSLMSECDAYFHFSLWDGIPNSVLEALSHSLPVFAYNSSNSSLSDLKEFQAPIFFFDSFCMDELLIGFRSFLIQCVFSSDFAERSKAFYSTYSSQTSLTRIIFDEVH